MVKSGRANVVERLRAANIIAAGSEHTQPRIKRGEWADLDSASAACRINAYFYLNKKKTWRLPETCSSQHLPKNVNFTSSISKIAKIKINKNTNHMLINSLFLINGKKIVAQKSIDVPFLIIISNEKKKRNFFIIFLNARWADFWFFSLLERF